MANLILRMSPSGPRIGNPPVQVTPNLANLVLAATGVTQVDSFAAATQQPVWWTDADDYVSLPMRAGYRYVMQARLAVKTVNATASANFKPRWNARVKSSGAYISPDATAPSFNGSIFSSHFNAASPRYAGADFIAMFSPAVDHDRLKLLLEVDGGGFQADAALDSGASWLLVWELGGVLPPT